MYGNREGIKSQNHMIMVKKELNKHKHGKEAFVPVLVLTHL